MPDLSKRPERYATAFVTLIAASAFCYFGLGLRVGATHATASSQKLITSTPAKPSTRSAPTRTVTATAAARGVKATTGATPSATASSGGPSCASFPNREAAQIFWNQHRARYPSWDGNHNGVACEQLKSVTAQATKILTKTQIITRNRVITRTEPAAPKPPPPTPEPVTKPTAPSKALIMSSRQLFGIHAPTPDAFTGIEQTLARTAQIQGYFQGWDTDFRPSVVNAAWAANQLPFLTWESRPLSGGSTAVDYSLANIANGQFDAYVRKYADAIKANGLPLMIRFDQEMNGNWYRWGETNVTNPSPPGSYIAAWRHIYDIFQQEGANNLVIWDWSPNRVTRDGLDDHTAPLYYYPGDAYVDVLGMSGYFRSTDTEPTFSRTYDRTLGYLRALSSNKPIMLSEVGATENHGEKVAFIKSFFAGLPDNPDIMGFAWFDFTVTSIVNGKTTTDDWRINSSPAATDAFRTGIYAANWGLPTGRHQVWGKVPTPTTPSSSPGSGASPPSSAPASSPAPAPTTPNPGSPTPTPTPTP